ncbi:hypothetical protein DS710_18900 [Salmonella enterica subsp. enterica serovar Kedougou]|nr:hypothetical protein [Salmonella enterica subsp. enterica serovar Kedougou]EBS4218285.1 hypothetical protein [Salmonella enterica subsp. enterica serovar Cannstatt]ECY5257520.1 hypothetical protein [Salmonella enterica subsp. enterica serovar Kedougou]EDW2315981.1 hypothetical protein [Salmonella enterica subsp. enterica]
MRLNIIAGGLITEVYDDHDKKVGSVSMSKQERHRNKPYTDGKQFYASFNEALLALRTRKKVNIHNVF